MIQLMQHEREKDIGFIIQAGFVLIIDPDMRRIKTGIVFDSSNAGTNCCRRQWNQFFIDLRKVLGQIAPTKATSFFGRLPSAPLPYPFSKK